MNSSNLATGKIIVSLVRPGGMITAGEKENKMKEYISLKEIAWVANATDHEAALWVVRYARAINTLNADLLEDGLATDVTYESQSVSERLDGPGRLLNYWRGKFRTIRRSDAVAAAELACLPDGKPCAAIYQAASAKDTNWLEVPKAVLTVEANMLGQATSFLMITCVPSPSSAQGSGIFPGRTKVPSERPQRFIRSSPGFEEITLYVFYLDSKTRLDRAMAEGVAKVRRDLDGIRIVELHYQEMDAQSEWEVNDVFGFNGFPSVGALFKGSPIYRHQGVIGGNDLVAALRAASPPYVVTSRKET